MVPPAEDSLSYENENGKDQAVPTFEIPDTGTIVSYTLGELRQQIEKAIAGNTQLDLDPNKLLAFLNNRTGTESPASPVLADQELLLQARFQEMQQSMQQLQKFSSELEFLFNNSLDMMGVAGSDGYFKKINPAFARILGYSEAEFLSQPFLDFVHPDDIAATQKAMEELNSGINVASFENSYRCRDGTYKQLEWTTKPVTTEEGISYCAVARDISYRSLVSVKTGPPQLERVETAKSLRILVVEDREDDYTLMCSQFSKVPGYRFDRVDKQNDLIKALQSGQYDLVISDYSLPQFNALDVLKITGEYSPFLPVIVVSGLLQDEEAAHVIQQGAKQYIRKDHLHELPKAVPAIYRESRDQNNRKKEQEAMHERDRMLSLLLEGARDYMITLVKPDGEIISWNTGGERTKGYTSEEILGKNIACFYSQQDRDTREPEQHLTTALETGRFEDESWKLRKDGSRFWANTIITPLYDEYSIFVGYTIITRDITSRHEAEAKIRWQSELLNKAPDAIIFSDLDGTITFWNASAERTYGLNESQVLGKNVRDILYAENGNQFDQISHILQQKGQWMDEYQHKTLANDKIIIQSRYNLIRDETDNPSGILIMNTDITERKKIESQLTHMQRMEGLGALAARIAHDLNNDLVPMMMVPGIMTMKLGDIKSKLLELIRKGNQFLKEGNEFAEIFPWLGSIREVFGEIITILEKRIPEMINQVGMMNESAGHAKGLVESILGFSRNKEGIHISISVQTILSQLSATFKSSFPESIQIRVDTPKDLWTIRADPIQIQQVMTNLGVNARDAMKSGGELKISAENLYLDLQYGADIAEFHEGPYVVITVSDNGTGIPPEHIEKIFDPFFTTKEDGGTGLGLYTSFSIVRNHKGFIRVYSEVNKGTRFRVYLPATPDKNIKEIQELTQLPQGKGETILLVEDKPEVLKATKAILEENGYKVITATDGIEAVASYAKNKETIDLTLTDISMPEMDGRTAIDILTKVNPSIKILAASGLSIDSQHMKDIPVTILQKPYNAFTLLTALRRELDIKPEE